ncbi:MAG TPA: ATP-binding protein [Opitutaceae bacterium]|nr:ATP-binding protein [Opitutaceae bacterium]
MPRPILRRLHVLLWVLIAVGGGAVGWWRAAHAGDAIRRALLVDAQRCAVAFTAAEMGSLAGSPADLANPAYLSVKFRLARLRQVNPGLRSVCIVRYLPASGGAILLADSESPESRKIATPGDGYGGAGRLPNLQTTLGGVLPTCVGPLADSSGAWIIAFALIGGRAPAGSPEAGREILALEVAADHWLGDLFAAGLRTAVYVWLLLGLPWGGWLALRRQRLQGDLIQRLSQAVEQNRSALVITGPDRRIEYVNAGLCAITGWRREELVGQPVRMLASSETADAQYQDILDTVRAGRTWQGEAVNRRKDGSTYPARAIASPVHDSSGRLAHIIAVMEDISERKQVEAALVYARERAEAGERAKGQFLAMMGHEIRTPLNGIIGFASLLLDTPLTAEQRECVQTIHNSGASLLQLTSDVLDYSRIDAGHLSLEPQPCSPLACIEFALEALAAPAAERRLELLHAVVGEVPAAVLADESRLRQVLVNLVGNAVKFTAVGEIEVTVEAEPLPDERTATRPPGAPARSWSLTFAVRDTGIGIAPDERDKLFKPFSQIDSSTTRKYGGAGLGLAISQSLVRMMGGDISLQSEVGRGSTFTFTVVAGEASAAPGPDERSDLAALRGRTLAVVSASAPLRRELVRLAGEWGMHLIECPREQLAAEIWDTALVELVPAEATAWRQVFAQRPELPSRPLVALISVDFPTAERDALRGSFRALISKPARHGALRALLAASLQPAAPTGAVRGAGSTLGSGLGLRVLLVEDNPVNQRLTQKLLENLGCDWDLAEDGPLALARLSRGTYDLVLVDLWVPEVDGRALVEQIRRGGAGAISRNIWIIVCTAADTPESERRQIMAVGVSDCLAKPFRPADLEAALRRAMGYTPPRA